MGEPLQAARVKDGVTIRLKGCLGSCRDAHADIRAGRNLRRCRSRRWSFV